MKIGDTVAIGIGLDRHLVFGKLLAVVAGEASVLVEGFRHVRQLKRVKTATAARKEMTRRMKRERFKRIKTASAARGEIKRLKAKNRYIPNTKGQ